MFTIKFRYPYKPEGTNDEEGFARSFLFWADRVESSIHAFGNTEAYRKWFDTNIGDIERHFIGATQPYDILESGKDCTFHLFKLWKDGKDKLLIYVIMTDADYFVMNDNGSTVDSFSKNFN